MKFEIDDYKPKYDKELLELFYRSIFYKKKEFEYVRVPNRWIYRYTLADDYLVKIAKVDGNIIASVGVLIRNGTVNGRAVKIGCFVDNCILPEYLDSYDEIFTKLFNDLEKACKHKKVDIIQGWDFLKNVELHKEFWKALGYTWKGGINWYPGGFDYKGGYPVEWQNNVNFGWKVFFKAITLYHKIKEKILQKLPEGVMVRNMEDRDIPSVYGLIKEDYSDTEFAPHLTLEEFQEALKKNSIHGIVSEKNEMVIGALTYITSAWSGWMYGKPYYSDKWQVFYTFTPDEFVVVPEYRNTSIASHMALKLLKVISPHKKDLRKNSYGFIADIFDRRIEWRRNAYLKVGCFEPKADFGVILSKPLRSGIKPNKDKIWSLPARYIIAPVPPSENSNPES